MNKKRLLISMVIVLIVLVMSLSLVLSAGPEHGTYVPNVVGPAINCTSSDPVNKIFGTRYCSSYYNAFRDQDIGINLNPDFRYDGHLDSEFDNCNNGRCKRDCGKCIISLQSIIRKSPISKPSRKSWTV